MFLILIKQTYQDSIDAPPCTGMLVSAEHFDYTEPNDFIYDDAGTNYYGISTHWCWRQGDAIKLEER